MIFILQSLRNMFIHFHQCNDDAQQEIDGSNQNNMDSHRKNRLIDIFKSIFPFLGDRLVLTWTKQYKYGLIFILRRTDSEDVGGRCW